MIQIQMCGLFLTCTDNSFYSSHIYNKSKRVHFCLKEKYSYLEKQSLVHGGEFPSSQVPCLKLTALAALALPSPPAPASRQEKIYLHTDDIN
jgi:hypothetical protein